MEKSKFTPLATKSGQKKIGRYAVNKPNIKHTKLKEFTGSFTSLFNKQPKSIRIDARDGYSRLSVLNRAASMTKQNKFNMINSTLSKSTLKKMKRYHTQAPPVQKQNIYHLKKHIKNIAKQCNELDQRFTVQSGFNRDLDDKSKRERNKRFMMAHLSFSQIEEDKVQTQQTFLNNIRSLKSTTFPSKMVETSRATQKLLRQRQDRLVETFRLIDKIYSTLRQMQQIGYVIKSNKYVITFCTTVKFWLTDVFLVQSSDKKDSFSIKTKYFVLENQLDVKQKLSSQIIKGIITDMSVITNDVEELFQYVQTCFSQKKIQQVSNITNYVSSRLNYHKSKDPYIFNELRITNYLPQNYDFSSNLVKLQQKYGPMKEISRVSRNRFEDLSRTFQKLQGLL